MRVIRALFLTMLAVLSAERLYAECQGYKTGGGDVTYIVRCWDDVRTCDTFYYSNGSTRTVCVRWVDIPA